MLERVRMTRTRDAHLKRAAALNVWAGVLVLVSAGLLAQSAEKHFIWEVQRGTGAPTYLVGSLHVLTKAHYPLPAAFEKAFEKSTVLIEEIDLDELSDPAQAIPLLAKSMYADGRTLDQAIAPSLYQQVIERAAKAGLPMALLQRMKPWMAAVTLIAPALQSAGFDPSLGVDRYFLEKAKARALEHRGLETAESQFDRLDGMPPAVQEAMLRAMLSDLDAQLANVETIAAAWAKGDASTIERLMLGAFLESPELYQRLIVERNRNWVEPIENTCLHTNTSCFVVVGAGHLVGPHGVVAMLAKKGYRVEQH